MGAPANPCPTCKCAIVWNDNASPKCANCWTAPAGAELFVVITNPDGTRKWVRHAIEIESHRCHLIAANCAAEADRLAAERQTNEEAGLYKCEFDDSEEAWSEGKVIKGLSIRSGSW